MSTSAALQTRAWRGLRLLGTSLRAHQWVKNILVFIPLVLGGRALDPEAWIAALLGFISLSLVCSATYLINDLSDLEHDRQHRTKRERPLASGELTRSTAMVLAVTAVTVGTLISVPLGLASLAVLLTYVLLTLSYTFKLKQVAILDVFVIASLFTLRLIYGIAITGVRVSPWLLIFSIFTFMSLSLAKRYTEANRLTIQGQTAIPGRGYFSGDAPLILAFGAAASLGAVLILILYLIEDAFPRDFYSSPEFLWVLPAILFLFFGRVWLESQRDKLDDDPIMFALKDLQTLIYGAIALSAVALAIV